MEGVWDEKGREMFRQKLKKVELGEGRVQEEWKRLEKRVKVAVEGTERERGEEKKGMDSGTKNARKGRRN